MKGHGFAGFVPSSHSLCGEAIDTFDELTCRFAWTA